jgi:hypothetical protein
MSLAQLEARANARAREQHVHIFAVPGRLGVYQTSSKSEPGKKYTLVAKNAIEACSCRGFEYRRSCKHVEALRNRLAREARKASVTPIRAGLLYADGPEAA